MEQKDLPKLSDFEWETFLGVRVSCELEFHNSLHVCSLCTHKHFKTIFVSLEFIKFKHCSRTLGVHRKQVKTKLKYFLILLNKYSQQVTQKQYVPCGFVYKQLHFICRYLSVFAVNANNSGLECLLYFKRESWRNWLSETVAWPGEGMGKCHG